jgi:hypothetical protein
MRSIELELDALVGSKPYDIVTRICLWLQTSYVASSAPSLIIEIQLVAYRDPVFLNRYQALKDSQTRKLASFIERHLGPADTSVGASYVANTLISLAQGLHLQRLMGQFPHDSGGAQVLKATLLTLCGKDASFLQDFMGDHGSPASVQDATARLLRDEH